MRKKNFLFYHIFTFVAAQLAWLLLLGLWIYWYVTNYIIFEKAGDQLSPQIVYDATNVLPFVGGLILLVGISFSTSLIFRNLNVQLKLNNLYTNFISNVTHELKSPLSSIQLYLETLNSRYVPVEKRNEFYESMIKDAERLKNLINSILEISSLEQKKGTHDFQVYSADSIIKSLINNSLDKFYLDQEILSFSGSAPCQCLIDAKALKIVFDNLVDNAIKYTIEPLKLKITLSCTQKNIVIGFSDNGIGIPANEINKIFNKFYRVDSPRSPNVKGTGLGLHLVKEIIKFHDGKISAASMGDNMGTTFIIELPIYDSSDRRILKNLLRSSKNYIKITDNDHG